jgi:hypothetical protein
LHEFKGMLLAAVGKSLELFHLRPAAAPAPAAAAAATLTPAAGGAAPAQAQQQPSPPCTLVKAGFYESPHLISSVAVVKDFVLLGDVHTGCTFLRYNVCVLHVFHVGANAR